MCVIARCFLLGTYICNTSKKNKNTNISSIPRPRNKLELWQLRHEQSLLLVLHVPVGLHPFGSLDSPVVHQSRQEGERLVHGHPRSRTAARPLGERIPVKGVVQNLHGCPLCGLERLRQPSLRSERLRIVHHIRVHPKGELIEGEDGVLGEFSAVHCDGPRRVGLGHGRRVDGRQSMTLPQGRVQVRRPLLGEALRGERAATAIYMSPNFLVQLLLRGRVYRQVDGHPAHEGGGGVHRRVQEEDANVFKLLGCDGAVVRLKTVNGARQVRRLFELIQLAGLVTLGEPGDLLPCDAIHCVLRLNVLPVRLRLDAHLVERELRLIHELGDEQV
mmetsp:Transcript_627/g.883  ORF Transcript_627/g.883 Transcript_627/m.883 type:complete len:331 (-) Transcript_627:1061-2053(-)